MDSSHNVTRVRERPLQLPRAAPAARYRVSHSAALGLGRRGRAPRRGRGGRSRSRAPAGAPRLPVARGPPAARRIHESLALGAHCTLSHSAVRRCCGPPRSAASRSSPAKKASLSTRVATLPDSAVEVLRSTRTAASRSARQRRPRSRVAWPHCWIGRCGGAADRERRQPLQPGKEGIAFESRSNAAGQRGAKVLRSTRACRRPARQRRPRSRVAWRRRWIGQCGGAADRPGPASRSSPAKASLSSRVATPSHSAVRRCCGPPRSVASRSSPAKKASLSTRVARCWTGGAEVPRSTEAPRAAPARQRRPRSRVAWPRRRTAPCGGAADRPGAPPAAPARQEGLALGSRGHAVG